LQRGRGGQASALPFYYGKRAGSEKIEPEGEREDVNRAGRSTREHEGENRKALFVGGKGLLMQQKIGDWKGEGGGEYIPGGALRKIVRLKGEFLTFQRRGLAGKELKKKSEYPRERGALKKLEGCRHLSLE